MAVLASSTRTSSTSRALASSAMAISSICCRRVLISAFISSKRSGGRMMPFLVRCTSISRLSAEICANSSFM
jgi:hypothetical protein